MEATSKAYIDSGKAEELLAELIEKGEELLASSQWKKVRSAKTSVGLKRLPSQLTLQEFLS